MHKTVIRSDFDETSIDMTFMVTTFCNYNCIYCIERIPAQEKTDLMDLSKAITFIKDYIRLFPSHKISVRIYGGEPTTHPDLLDFCEKANSLPEVTIVEIFTNFSADYIFYEKILSMPKLHIFTSYHQSDIMSENEYIEKLTQLSRYLEKMTLNIMLENCMEESFNETYCLYKTVMKKFRRYSDGKAKIELIPLFSTKDYYSSYGEKNHNILEMVNDRNNEKIEFTVIDEKGHASKTKKVVGYHSFNFKNWLCTSGKNAIFIDTQGYVYPCGGLYTKRHEIREMSERVNVFNQKPVKDMFKKTICPHNDCVLCVPMKVENVKDVMAPIEETDEKYAITEKHEKTA